MPVAVSPASHFEIATGTSPLACVPPSSFRTFSINAEQYLASADWPNAANGTASDVHATRKAVVVRAFILLSHVELKISITNCSSQSRNCSWQAEQALRVFAIC